jgi:hypothetical protein
MYSSLGLVLRCCVPDLIHIPLDHILDQYGFCNKVSESQTIAS